MNLKVCISLFLVGFARLVYGQGEMFSAAFEEFSKARIWAYEEIPVDWKMDPALQADFNEGLNNLLEDKFDIAEAAFSNVITKAPKFWQAYYFRAAAWKKQRKLGSALYDLEKVLNLNPKSYEANVEHAKVLHLLGVHDESERAINKAIRLDKSKPVAHYVRGEINLNQNQPRIATTSYRDCIAADSLFHDARIMLSLMDLVAQQNPQAALHHLDRVLLYDSLQKTALLFRAILAHDRDKRQCIKDLTSLLSVSPNHLIALFLRGLYLTNEGEFSQAFSDFHKVIRNTELSDNAFKGQQTWMDKKIDLQNAGAYTVRRVYGLEEDDGLKLKQAYCHIITEDFDRAILILERVYNPKREPLAMYLMAVAHEHKGKHAEALVYYNKALALDNDIADAHKKRGIYAQELKDWKQSVIDLTDVLRLNPESYVIYRMRGVSYYYLDEFRKAIADYDKYLQHDSTDEEVVGYRGMAYLKCNDRLNAYADFSSSGNRELIKFADASSLIDSVFLTGDTTAAMTYINRIADGTPTFTEGWVKKFTVHLLRNEWKPIEADIHRALRNSRRDAERSHHSFLLTVSGMVYFKNRHQDDAVKAFDEAIRFDKKNALAYLERGKAWMTMGKSSKAESDFRTALSLGNQQAEQMLANLTK